MKKILISLFALGFAISSQAAQFTSDQTTEIQQVVHDYLIAHPEILVQMSQELQQKQYQAMQQQALKAIDANSDKIFNAQGTQIAGNPNGKVTLVEFFDYQCVHCANLHKDHVIEDLISKNPELRVVYKEFPIFGDASIYAAKAAMAAAAQGKYLAMHDGIFNTGKIEGQLKPADVDKVAQKIDLNMAKYRAYIKGAAGKTVIDEDYQLAQALGIQGTPSFIIAPTPKVGNSSAKTTFIPGLVGASDMQQAIDAAQ